VKGLEHKEVVSICGIPIVSGIRAMIVLAYKHGMRTSEVCGLKMEDWT